MEKLTTRQQYDEVKARVEQLIAEATQKGLLESDMDNAYTQEIAALSQQMAEYEDEHLSISMPFAKRLHSKLGIDANLILEYA